MFDPKYRILLTSKCFPGDKVVCLGTQLISIVKLVGDLLPQHVWYGADIEAVGHGARKRNFSSLQPNLIGTDLQLIEYCSEIEQFIWGEFLCVAPLFSQNIQNIELETEDKPFRSIACDGILMEIRTFDTTYFGVYSEGDELINKISKQYNVEVEKLEK
jgi:hypothetical protein